MSAFRFAATFVLLLACAPTTYQHTVTAPAADDDIFNRARSGLVSMGYSIQDADRDGGLLRAEKTESTGMMDLGQRTDRLIVSIGADQVQITAETDWGSYGEEEERSQVSDQAQSDAEELRRRLSEGSAGDGGV